MSDDDYDQAAKEVSYLQGQLWVMAAVAFAVVAAVGTGDSATIVGAATLATGLSMVMAGGLLVIHVGLYTDTYENAADGAKRLLRGRGLREADPDD